MKVPIAQILVCNNILQYKELGLFGQRVDSRPGVGNVQDKPRASCSAKNKVLKKKPCNDGARESTERAPNGRRWNNLSNQIK